MNYFLLLMLLSSSLWGAPCIEMYMEWHREAKGDEIFPLQEDPKGLFPKLRRAFYEKGIDLKSWELERHRSELLRWSGVQSLSDFWVWLFPKRSDLEEKVWLFWSLGPGLKSLDLGRVPKEKKVLMIFEPPTVQKEGYDPAIWDQFGKVITWDDDLVDGGKFVKYYYPVLRERIEEIVPFEEKKFCSMFATRRASRHSKELYSERERVIRFFEKREGDFDLYGNFWEKRKYRNWKGRIEDKIGVLKGYKFNICYENMRDIRGYVTEKIFDCFTAGVVPVYLGASNIEEYVPKECFIDRREFADEEALYQFMKGMGKEEYEGYLRSAQEFLGSEKAALFSEKNFVQTVVGYLENPSS